ncbi:specific histone demethylase 1A [Seminavis robusta]|uniref:Specific histone demethylase 1A n=1 Tax=Seminavis robusta TaxID=568900 RepID=A0A9N8HEI9_9STRA|nr:specific histone demethylase 1A [Seminavis robusta]|eukprot:Sro306_g113050.1 specific histone demethylase 1A (606) ;mRNA; r:48584-50401
MSEGEDNNEDPHGDDHESNRRVKVIIVGAGAAGLTCVAKLLESKVVSHQDILILEARDRIGGRIHTTQEAILPIDQEGSNPVTVFRDHGAAWVHGTGYEWSATSTDSNNNNEKPLDATAAVHDDNEFPINPMIQLLTNNSKEGLEPVFERGNPWTRPGHVLLGLSEKDETTVAAHNKPNLVLFVNGRQIGGTQKDVGENKPDTTIFRAALQRHAKIMQQVGQIGYQLISSGQTLKTVEQSFQQAVDEVMAQQQEQSNPTIELVAGFYRYLITCWHGTSASGLQLHEFAEWENDDLEEDNNNHQLDDAEYQDEGDFYGPHCTVKRGMQTLLDPLLQTVSSSCIRLGQPVTRIEKQQSSDSDEHVIVETESGMTIAADYCVVTVPLGCLAHSIDNHNDDNNDNNRGAIAFTPNLSQEKLDAIRHLQMGSYKKVFLQFDRIFWPKQEPFLGLVRNASSSDAQKDDLGPYLLLDNLWARNNLPCIEAVLIGDAGIWATGKSDDTIRTAVLAFAANAMGLDSTVLHKWCVECHVTRWEEDPYSRGAYSGYRLGTLEEHTQALATTEWEGRLFFGGEATQSGCEGSVHAALNSGESLAKDLQNVITEKSQR